MPEPLSCRIIDGPGKWGFASVPLIEPTDKRSAQILLDADRDKNFVARISAPRSQQRNKWWHALVQACADALDDHELPFTVLREVLKIECGAVHVVERNGNLWKIPKSLAFHKMKEEEFTGFCDRTLWYMLTKLLPGMRKGLLLERVKELSGLKERPE